MKRKKLAAKDRNWGLVFIASIIILLGISLIVLAITNISVFGWWSLLVGVMGFVTASAATMSIIQNDPTWILLDLIIPF